MKAKPRRPIGRPPKETPVKAKDEITPDNLVPIKEVPPLIMRRSMMSIYRMLERGELRGTRIGERRYVFKSSIDEMLANGNKVDETSLARRRKLMAHARAVQQRYKETA